MFLFVGVNLYIFNEYGCFFVELGVFKRYFGICLVRLGSIFDEFVYFLCAVFMF